MLDFTKEKQVVGQPKGMVFGKMNYTIMLIGIALLVCGFLIMCLETAEYGFGNLGLTIGPFFLLAGFLVEFVAILYKGKNE